jgi:hypothetical protein
VRGLARPWPASRRRPHPRHSPSTTAVSPSALSSSTTGALVAKSAVRQAVVSPVLILSSLPRTYIRRLRSYANEDHCRKGYDFAVAPRLLRARVRRMSGTKVGHAMAPSRKERISVVIYSRPQTTISREPQLRSVRARERAMSLWHGFHRHSSAAARTKYAMKFGNAARRVGHRNLWMRGIFGQGVTDHDRKQYRGHFESQMVCFRALGVQGRACCSIALQVMTRLKFSSAIRLRNFRDLILIGGGHPSLISSGSRSLSGRNPNRRRPSQLTLITRIVAGTLIASLTQ